MEIKKIKNNTYYIDSVVNIGLYTENNRDYVLIDTGYSGKMAEELLKTLNVNGINVVGIINTHSHVDHVGGNQIIKKAYNCIVAAPAIENTFIEYPKISGMYLYPAAPFNNVYKTRPPACKVDISIDDSQSTIEIGKYSFSILPLRGHSPNHIGIATPDNVIFCGDAFLGIEAFNELKLLFNYDLIEDIASKKFLLKTDYDYYIPSHGNPLTDISSTIEYNIDRIENISTKILSLLETPLNLDQIMGLIVNNFNIKPDLIPYLIGQACLCGFISYLVNTDKIHPIIDNGILKYKRKKA